MDDKTECEKYSEQIALISSVEEDNPLLEEAIEHLKGCAHCQEEKLAFQQFDAVVEEEIHAVPIPPFLASRITNRIRSSAESPRREWRWSYALSAAAICLLIFVSYNQLQILSRIDIIQTSKPINSMQELQPSHYALLDIVATMSAKRHQNILSSRFVVFDDNLTNESFKGKFSFKITLPDFSRKLRLVGGSKCHSCSYEMAYLLYRTDTDSVSLCVFSAGNFGLANWSGKPTVFKKKNYNVAVWKKDNLVYAMVSHIPESETKSIIWDSQQ